MRGFAFALSAACLIGLGVAEHYPAEAEQSGPQLPPSSKLKDGMPRRAVSGDIVLEAASTSIRVCSSLQGPSCHYTDIAAAAAAASPGSEIVLAPGVYEQAAVITVDGLTLRGEPGAHLRGQDAEGKAALVVRAQGVTIDGIECSRIEVADGNGACIRIEGDDLTVRNVYFHDNQEGILSGPGRGTVLIENSRFERNGWGGRAHAIYIGYDVEEFIFRGNSVLATRGEGHGVKSRARRTRIEDNIIASLGETDSRAIDVPNGGDVVIRRNLLEKGAQSSNDHMIGVGLEGRFHEANQTMVQDNLIIFDPPQTALSKTLSSLVDVVPPQGIVLFSRAPGDVVLRGNVIVKAREIGNPTIEEENARFDSRSAAGLPPYPEVNRSMIDQALRAR